MPIVEVADVEQTVVIEGLQGKMKGLEQTIVTEQNTVKGFCDMVFGLSEKVDSSLGTVAPPFYGRRPSEVLVLSLLGSPWISSSS